MLHKDVTVTRQTDVLTFASSNLLFPVFYNGLEMTTGYDTLFPIAGLIKSDPCEEPAAFLFYLVSQV